MMQWNFRLGTSRGISAHAVEIHKFPRTISARDKQVTRAGHDIMELIIPNAAFTSTKNWETPDFKSSPSRN